MLVYVGKSFHSRYLLEKLGYKVEITLLKVQLGVDALGCVLKQDTLKEQNKSCALENLGAVEHQLSVLECAERFQTL